MADTTVVRRIQEKLLSDQAMWLVAPGLVLLIQQVVWPAPLGSLVQGVVIGLITALVALGIVLVYRANRVLNFAQGELGLLPVTLAVMLMIESGFPYVFAFAIGLSAALAVGVASEFLVIRRFSDSPRLILTVATLGLATLLGLTALLIPRWWDASVSSQRIDSPLDISFDVGNFRFNDNHLIVLVGVPIVLMAVSAMLRYTRLGIGIRASAERPNRASTLGIPVKGLQSIVWALASALAFIALFLRASVIGLPVGGALGLLFFLRALAAAVVGRLTDIRTVLTTSVALGVLQQGIVWNSDSPTRSDALTAAVIAGVILVSLVARPNSFARSERSEAALSMGETRPVPAELAARYEVKGAVVALVLLVLGFVVAVPYMFDTINILRVATLFMFTITTLSLVVLTGWAGQISLGQVALSGAGGAVAASLIIRWQVDLILAILAAGICAAALAVLIGLPALRLSGLYLAVTTLAFEVAMASYFLNTRFFEWLPSDRVPRLPVLGRFGYTSPTGIYVVSAVALAFALFAVRSLRSTRTGRVLLALRDNEPGVTAYGVSVTRAKLMAFAISGFLAGMSGALLAVNEQAFSGIPAGASIGVLISAVVGGIGSILGAVLGSLFQWGTLWWLEGTWRLLASGIGVLLVLLIAPGGLAAMVYQLRDYLLRRLAKVRGIHVPSMVADDLLPDAVGATETEDAV